ncbi:hypothetical protein EE612_059517 [Oryza sativa]|nr:hypothetical protein EE612_059517 [Oryza sativa]
MRRLGTSSVAWSPW